MKNINKRYGFIVVIAIIGLTFAALSLAGCNKGGGSSPPTAVGGSGSGSAEANAVGGGDGNTGTSWPPNSVLSKVDLDGMSQPPGVTDIVWVSSGRSENSITVESLVIYFNAAEASKTYIRNWFASKGWNNRVSVRR